MDKDICITDIYDLLAQLSVTPKYKGFRQTAYAIELCAEQPERLLCITKQVYCEVAKHCGTNWKAVERNMRTVCGIIWQNSRSRLIKLSPMPLNKKPRTAEFLSIILYSLGQY